MNYIPHLLYEFNKAKAKLLILTADPRGIWTHSELWMGPWDAAFSESLFAQAPHAVPTTVAKANFLGPVMSCPEPNLRLQHVLSNIFAEEISFYFPKSTLLLIHQISVSNNLTLVRSKDYQEVCNFFIDFLCFPVFEFKESWLWMITKLTKQLKPLYPTVNFALLSKHITSIIGWNNWRLWVTHYRLGFQR